MTDDIDNDIRSKLNEKHFAFAVLYNEIPRLHALIQDTERDLAQCNEQVNRRLFLKTKQKLQDNKERCRAAETRDKEIAFWKAFREVVRLRFEPTVASRWRTIDAAYTLLDDADRVDEARHILWRNVHNCELPENVNGALGSRSELLQGGGGGGGGGKSAKNKLSMTTSTSNTNSKQRQMSVAHTRRNSMSSARKDLCRAFEKFCTEHEHMPPAHERALRDMCSRCMCALLYISNKGCFVCPRCKTPQQQHLVDAEVMSGGQDPNAGDYGMGNLGGGSGISGATILQTSSSSSSSAANTTTTNAAMIMGAAAGGGGSSASGSGSSSSSQYKSYDTKKRESVQGRTDDKFPNDGFSPQLLCEIYHKIRSRGLARKYVLPPIMLEMLKEINKEKRIDNVSESYALVTVLSYYFSGIFPPQLTAEENDFCELLHTLLKEESKYILPRYSLKARKNTICTPHMTKFVFQCIGRHDMLPFTPTLDLVDNRQVYDLVLNEVIRKHNLSLHTPLYGSAAVITNSERERIRYHLQNRTWVSTTTTPTTILPPSRKRSRQDVNVVEKDDDDDDASGHSDEHQQHDKQQQKQMRFSTMQPWYARHVEMMATTPACDNADDRYEHIMSTDAEQCMCI